MCLCDGVEIDESSKYTTIGFEVGYERQPETDVMNWKQKQPKSRSFLSIYVGLCVYACQRDDAPLAQLDGFSILLFCIDKKFSCFFASNEQLIESVGRNNWQKNICQVTAANSYLMNPHALCYTKFSSYLKTSDLSGLSNKSEDNNHQTIVKEMFKNTPPITEKNKFFFALLRSKENKRNVKP